jgi:SAM-dependent methyltransferase
VRALEAARPVGSAVDLGAGDGTETLALLDRGWSVVAVDAEPASAAALAAAAPPGAPLTVVTRDMAEVDLPPADLVLAAFSLFFLPRPAFEAVWSRLREALRPGGVVAGHLLLERDSWAALPGITALGVDEARRRLAGLEVLAFDEQEHDGQAYSGPKHWHLVELVARRPG